MINIDTISAATCQLPWFSLSFNVLSVVIIFLINKTGSGKLKKIKKITIYFQNSGFSLIDDPFLFRYALTESKNFIHF